MSITPKQALDLLLRLELGGLRAPDVLTVPAQRAGAARMYAESLTAAGCTFADAEAGVVAYLAEHHPGHFPKPWPDAGSLAARTPRARLLAAAGGDVDTDAAWDAFRQRMRILHRYNQPRRDDPARQLDADSLRNTAMFAAMASIGGPTRYYDADETDPHVAREWKRAYSAVRKQQAADPAAGAAMIAGAERRMLTAGPPVPEAK